MKELNEWEEAEWIDREDLDDLIAKIEKYLALSNEERKQLGINGRKKVEKEFDRNIVINKYLEEIKRITDNRHE